MDHASRVIAEITGCTAEQTQAVIAALIKGGWSPPSTEPPLKAEEEPTVRLSSLSDLPNGTVLVAHTDGACSGNPGPGGWSVVFSVGDAVVGKFCGRQRDTTNNQMELTAVREAITRAPIGAGLEIRTDSKNVLGWLEGGWKRNNPAIAALCSEIDALRAGRSASKGGAIRFRHVLGHNGDLLNELADKLAKGAVTRQ